MAFYSRRELLIVAIAIVAEIKLYLLLIGTATNKDSVRSI